MLTQMVGSWQTDNLSLPLQFVEFSEAYLDSSARLCRLLKKSTRKNSYPKGAVVIHLAFHAVELFLKGAILHRSPNEKLSSHDIQKLFKRYSDLYPEKQFNLSIPFKTEYLGIEPKNFVKNRNTPALDQVHRYPTDSNGRKWNGVFAFDPHSFLASIESLQSDFKHLRKYLFSAK